ncbi:MAG: hypothetical protein WCR52_07965 [Bacteroidota bacterium]
MKRKPARPQDFRGGLSKNGHESRAAFPEKQNPAKRMIASPGLLVV